MAKRVKKTATVQIQYVWTGATRTFPNATDADPNEIGLSLAAIAAAHGGRLETNDIWKTARSPQHPLHRFFEWNLRKAAENHWAETARRIARSVALIDIDQPDEPPKRAWISVEDDGISYRDVREVMTEADLQLAVMRRALSDLTAWQDRYRMLEGICGQTIKTARQQLVARLAASESRKTEEERPAI